MFETVTIQKGGWLAEVAPELGANVTKLQYNGEDVFIPLTSRDQLAVNPYLQGAPLLFPANRTVDARFTFEGRDYALLMNEAKNGAHLHGLLHTRPFTLVEAGDASVTLCYENGGEIYPFPFCMTVTYAVGEDGFEQRYTVKNTGENRMPFTFALHTTFVEPERFSVPIDMCQEKNEVHLPTGRYVALDEQEARYATGSASKGLTISGYYRACGNTARVGAYTYTASPAFDHWILFNGQGKSGLLCVEPQSGAVNGLNMDGGCTVLGPSEETTLWTKIERA